MLGLTLLAAQTVQAQDRNEAGPPPPLPAPGPGSQTNSTADEGLAKDSSTEINVKNADIAAVVRIFSKRTKRNYILDERVKGKVSIYLPGKVSADEAIRILDSVLSIKGFSSVPIGDNLWKIVPAQEARQTTIPTVTEIEGRGSAMIVTKLINLKFVSSEDAQKLITPLVSQNGLVNAYAGTNSLILIDSEDNIKRLTDIIEEIDLPFTDREMSLIPIKHADAADIAEKINLIIGNADKGDSSQTGQGGNYDIVRARIREAQAMRNGGGEPPPAQGGGSATVTVTGRSREPKIIPDERTNSLIVVADEDTFTRIRALVAQLDSEVNLSGNRFYVYRCQHANAEELVDALSGLTGGSSGGSSGSSGLGSSRSQNGSGLNGSSGGLGSRESDNRSQRTQNRLSQQQRTPGRPRSENRAQTVGSGNIQFSEDFSITADPATNSLIVSANKSDYEKLLDLLKQIDVKRRQVLVEALILEVGVDDSISTGMEFMTSIGGSDGGVLAANNYGGLTQLLSDPTKLSQLSVAAASSGSLTLPGGITIPTHTILMTAASNNTNVNVLSSPTILATDNEEAEIVVGQNVPFLASTSSSSENLSNTFNQIDRQDVGITLRITPQINSSDFVTLQIFTEVSNLVASTVTSDLGPTTTLRTSETTVVTKDNQMVITGGLISDSVSESDQGVPYLKDIPILGVAFRTKTTSKQKTNLLIFITPRIIKDQFDARDVTIEHRDELGNEIGRSAIRPDRQEDLYSDKIDKVIEGRLYEGDKPGTILPPPAPPAAPPAPVAPIVDSRKPESAEPEILEFDIKPKLPPQDSAALNSEQKTEPQARLNAAALTADQGDDYARLVVVQALEKPGVNLPFALAKNNLAILAFPKGSAYQAQSYFTTGKRYEFNGSKKPVQFRVMGVFDSTAEVGSFYQELKQARYYTLSPHEIMNLGSAPWKELE